LPYDNLLATKGANNQNFTWGNSLISAAGNDSADSYYYLQDHLGSPIRLLGGDDGGTALAYDEFGVQTVGAGDGLHNPFGFTGYQDDDVSGLYYAQARYYAPGLGRFVAEDTHWNPGNMIFGDNPHSMQNAGLFPYRLGIEQSKNLYAYCVCNPKAYIDPTGSVIIIYDHCSRQYVYTSNDDIAGEHYNLGYAVFPMRTEEATLNLTNNINRAGASLVAAPEANVTITAIGVRYEPLPSTGDVPTLGDRVSEVGDFVNRVCNAALNSLAVSASYGVGIEGEVAFGPLQAEVGAILIEQTHTYYFGSGEYTQRNSASVTIRLDLWEDMLGIRAQGSYGYTYSSISGYSIENGGLIPSSNRFAGMYAGGASLVLGTDERNSDWRLSFGGGLYAIIGGRLEVIFNLSEFARQMRKCGE